MKNALEGFRWSITPAEATPFVNAKDIYQDGTTPMYRDAKGILWAMSGHTHMGHIGMFCGSCLQDLHEVYPVHTVFATGGAGEAFDGVRYPEGILPRGSIWPFGLYICPVTNRFFCFFHNETGWNGHGTGYIITGKGDGEPDFRHIGLMHSDDCGRTWQFDRWVLTAQQVCFDERYRPEPTAALGQSGQETCLGCGDFSIFVEEEYIYLFYNLLQYDAAADHWRSCRAYVARTRRREDGVMGDFVKYDNGAFGEAGNLGRETPIANCVWHPRVVRSETLGCYLMTGSFADGSVENNLLVRDVMEVRTSQDLLHWSEPLQVPYNGGFFGNHYVAIAAETTVGQPYIVGNQFSLLSCHNGTDVLRYHVELHRDEPEK